MYERPVGLGHPVQFLAAPNRRTFASGRFHEFGGQAPAHGYALTGSGSPNDPPYCQRFAAVGPQVGGNLISSTADSAGLNLYQWGGVLER